MAKRLKVCMKSRKNAKNDSINYKRRVMKMKKTKSRSVKEEAKLLKKAKKKSSFKFLKVSER